jgi:heptosyltransferase-3
MKILFIRGGALGDFIVTLPTLRLLRQQWPDAHIEVLGHPRLSEIALNRYYLNAIRSVNHGPLSAFFTPRAVLDPDCMDYIGSFDLVLSYFYDPDGLFLLNLERCKPGRILVHSPRGPEDFGRPAARHFAAMVEPLGLALAQDAASDLFPSPEDAAAARAFVTGLKPETRLVAIHPGSGSEKKNWPVESWAELGRRLTVAAPDIALLLIEGEADAEPVQFLVEAWKDLPHLRARWLPLPILAALLGRAAVFLGHDSGITHLAAAARRDLPVIALFGPTDPTVWSPPRPDVQVLKGVSALKELSVDAVFQAAVSILERKSSAEAGA